MTKSFNVIIFSMVKINPLRYISILAIFFISLVNAPIGYASEVTYLNTPYKDKILRFSKNVKHAAYFFAPLKLDLDSWSAPDTYKTAVKNCIISRDCDAYGYELHEDWGFVNEAFQKFLTDSCFYPPRHTSYYLEVATIENLQGLNRDNGTDKLLIPFCHKGIEIKTYTAFTKYTVPDKHKTLSGWSDHLAELSETDFTPPAGTEQILTPSKLNSDIGDVTEVVYNSDGDSFPTNDLSIRNHYILNDILIQDDTQKQRCFKDLNPNRFHHFKRQVKIGGCYTYLPAKARRETSEYFRIKNPVQYREAANYFEGRLKFTLQSTDNSFCGRSISDYDRKISQAHRDALESFFVNKSKNDIEKKLIDRPKLFIIEEEVSPSFQKLNVNGSGNLSDFGPIIEAFGTDEFPHDISIIAQLLNDFLFLSFSGEYLEINVKGIPYNSPVYLSWLKDVLPSNTSFTIVSISRSFPETELRSIKDETNYLYVISTGNEQAALDAGGSHSGDKPSLIVVGGLDASWNGAAKGSTKRASVSVYAPSCGVRSYFTKDGNLIGKTDTGHSAGTSMAAPYVALTAALIRHLKPALNAGDIKKRIIEASDFNGKVNALNMADAISVNFDVVKKVGGQRIYGDGIWVELDSDNLVIRSVEPDTQLTCASNKLVSLENIIKWQKPSYLRAADGDIKINCEANINLGLSFKRSYDLNEGKIIIEEEVVPFDKLEYFYNSSR